MFTGGRVLPPFYCAIAGRKAARYMEKGFLFAGFLFIIAEKTTVWAFSYRMESGLLDIRNWEGR